MNNLRRFIPLASLLGSVLLAAGLAYFSPDVMTTRQKFLEFAVLLFGYLVPFRSP